MTDATDLAPEGPDEIVHSRWYAAPRQFVIENVKAREGGRQTLERLAHYVQTLG